MTSFPLVAVALATCPLQVVHGDLTTSNFMVRSGSEEVVAIDFGLAASQPLAEDKVRMPCIEPCPNGPPSLAKTDAPI